MSSPWRYVFGGTMPARPNARSHSLARSIGVACRGTAVVLLVAYAQAAPPSTMSGSSNGATGGVAAIDYTEQAMGSSATDSGQPPAFHWPLDGGWVTAI